MFLMNLFIYLFIFQEATLWSRTSLGSSPGNGSSFGTRGFLRVHWSRRSVWLRLSAPDWLRGFDSVADGPAPSAWEKKKKSPPEVSINQREVRGDRKRKEEV